LSDGCATGEKNKTREGIKEKIENERDLTNSCL
jgi:hypothetical protein